MQEELGLFNQRSADRSVTPVTRAGRKSGTVEFELQVKDRLPVHASVELDNRYTLDTSKLRLNASLGYSNLWQRDHSLTLNYQISPDDTDQVRVLVGTYLLRPLRSRKVFAFYGVDSNSDVATVGDINVHRQRPDLRRTRHPAARRQAVDGQRRRSAWTTRTSTIPSASPRAVHGPAAHSHLLFQLLGQPTTPRAGARARALPMAPA